MKKTIINFFIILFFLCLIGCDNTSISIPEERKLEPEWFDTYVLRQLEYGYYDDRGIHKSGWMQIKEDGLYIFGSKEQNEFFEKCKSLLGSTLRINENTVVFGGTYLEEILYSVSSMSSLEDKYINFENIFGEQTGEVKEFISNGNGRILQNYETKKITSRIIEIECSLFMPREGGLDFKPVATFTFEFYKAY